MKKKILFTINFLVLFFLNFYPLVAFTKDAYVIGVNMAVTGPGSETYAPIKDALDIYFKEINAKGGINGHPVEIIIEDNANQPSKAAAQVKKLVTQDKVLLLILASLSSTYAPVVEVCQRYNIPLFFGAVCPLEVYPPKPDPNQFCSCAFGSKFDTRFAISFIREQTGGRVKIGLAGMNIPISRQEVDYAEELAKSMGMEVVAKEYTPPPTPDYTPYATKIKDAGAQWAYSWAPWGMQIRTFEALRKIGWKGNYLCWAHIQAEDELERLKDDGLYVYGTNAFFADNSETHKKIKDSAEKAKSIYPYTQLTEGWIIAMTLESILKNTPWPPTTEKIRNVMSKINVDTRGLKGGPLIWTDQNHFRTITYHRVYKWDSKKKGIVLFKDWTSSEVK
jgi:ABC-type branched-subunit amino acid transport system substrate-binding protein